MSMSAQTLEMLQELGAQPEFEGEWEGALEFEWESELESEEFFGRLAGLAARAMRSPTLRRVGLAAARSALGGLGDIGAAIGGQPRSMGARVGGGIGAAAGRVMSDLLPEQEFEGEWEWEAEINPIRRAYPDPLMEHLGHAASATASEAEAEAFIGALVPLAARLIPQAAPVIARAAPQLIRGLAGVTRTLRSTPQTRPLVRALPTVVQRTARTIGRQAAAGRPVPPQAAVRTLARQAARTLSSPQQCVGAYQRSRALDRRYHGAVARSNGAYAAAGM